MSSATTMERRTYWCHECDMSISLIPATLTTTTTFCPHCTSDFLAELDSPITFDTQNNHHHHDRNLIFDSPYFHHVINHLFNNGSDQSSYGHDNNNTNTNSNNDHLTSGTTSDQNNKLLALSKGDIDSIKSVTITPQLLEKDLVVICAVCKELFVIDDDVKELPCKHMYHPGCIIPWLLIRNSCPVCRFQMPVQEEIQERELKMRRRSRSSVLRGEDFMDEHDGEEELFGFGLRHLARRHRFIFSMRRNDQSQQRQVEEEILFTPSRIGEEEVEVGDSARTDNVSSWPNWPVGDGGEIATGSASVNDDVDVVMS